MSFPFSEQTFLIPKNEIILKANILDQNLWGKKGEKMFENLIREQKIWYQTSVFATFIIHIN